MFKTKIFLIFLFLSTSIFAIREKELPSVKFLTKHSTHIVLVKLTSKKSFEGKSTIYTNYDFIVLKSFKGNLKKDVHIDLTFPGGRIGKRFSMTHSLPTYKKIKKYLLFLTENENGLNLFQGSLGSFSYDDNHKTFYLEHQKEKFSINDLINIIAEEGLDK